MLYFAAASSFSGRLWTQARPREWEEIPARGSMVVGVEGVGGVLLVVLLILGWKRYDQLRSFAQRCLRMSKCGLMLW